MSKHFFSDLGVMLGRSMRHIFRSMDTIITVTIVPIMMMLLFVYVYGGAIKTSLGTNVNYVNYMLPGVLLMSIASGITYTAVRLFYDVQGGIFERFHSMPITRSSMLWGHVLTSLVSNAISVVVIILVAFLIGFRPSVGGAVMACRGRDTSVVYAGPDMGCGDSRADCKIGGRRDRIRLPDHFPTLYQLRFFLYRNNALCRSRVCREPAYITHHRNGALAAQLRTCRQ